MGKGEMVNVAVMLLGRTCDLTILPIKLFQIFVIEKSVLCPGCAQLRWLCPVCSSVLVSINLQSAAVRPEGRLPTPATDVALCSNLGMQCVLVFELCCWLPFPCLCLAGTCP